jgi:hypothetical protein
LDGLHDHQPDDPIGEVGRADGGGLGGDEFPWRRRVFAPRRSDLDRDAKDCGRYSRDAWLAPCRRAGLQPSCFYERRFLLLPPHRRDGGARLGIQPQFGYHGSEANVHISIGQKTFDQADEFLAALRESVKACVDKGFSQIAAKVKAELKTMKPGAFGPSMMGDLMRAAGIEDGQLPRKSAELNQILNELPPAVTQFVLTEFMNDRYIYRPRH